MSWVLTSCGTYLNLDYVEHVFVSESETLGYVVLARLGFERDDEVDQTYSIYYGSSMEDCTQWLNAFMKRHTGEISDKCPSNCSCLCHKFEKTVMPLLINFLTPKKKKKKSTKSGTEKKPPKS